MPKIAIEIGTYYTKIFKSHQDVVLYEPTLIAIHKNNYKKPIAVGYEAEKLLGKAGEKVRVIRPVNNTTITDYKALCSLLNAFINKIKNGQDFSFDASVILIEEHKQNETVERIIAYSCVYNMEPKTLSVTGFARRYAYDNFGIAFVNNEPVTVDEPFINGIKAGIDAGLNMPLETPVEAPVETNESAE
jgi:hypothetical protein